MNDHDRVTLRHGVAQLVAEIDRLGLPDLETAKEWARLSTGPHFEIYAGLADFIGAKENDVNLLRSRTHFNSLYADSPPGELVAWTAGRDLENDHD